MLDGRCHCGACTVKLSRRPDSITQCNCSLCRTTGFRGIYYSSDEAQLAGDFDSYVRTDLDEVFLRNFRCSICGTATHWEPLTEPPFERMGINANLLDPAELEGVPIKQVDGATW